MGILRRPVLKRVLVPISDSCLGQVRTRFKGSLSVNAISRHILQEEALIPQGSALHLPTVHSGQFLNTHCVEGIGTRGQKHRSPKELRSRGGRSDPVRRRTYGGVKEAVMFVA